MDLIVSGSDEAILMVECGANGVTEQEVLDALDIAHARDQEARRGDRGAAQQAGKEKLEVEAPDGRRGPARADPLLARRQARRGDPDPREARAPGRDRRRRGGGRSSSTRRPARTASADPRARGRGRGRLREAREGHDPQADRRRQEAPRRPRRRTRSGRSRPRSTSRRACTARRCSPAARPRSSPTSRSARRAWT